MLRRDMMIYLDYNATTPVAADVFEAMRAYLEGEFGNPSSGHTLGRAAKEAVQLARERLARRIGADADEIVFTSGGTESNNMAILGGVLAQSPHVAGHVVISAIEHPATVEPARRLESMGYDLSVVPPTDQGVVTAEAVVSALRPETVLVSIMHANNEIGTLQPVEQIGAACRERNILFHVDAAQTVGKLAVDFAAMRADLLSVAGHKFYAPKGIGALVVRRGLTLAPILFGAGQQEGRRAGTENVAGIVALGAAADLVGADINEAGQRMAKLRDRLLDRLREGIAAELTLHGRGAERLGNTLSVSFPGVRGGELLEAIPRLCASTGAACHAGTIDVSATLAAIGVAPETAAGTVRLSLGRATTAEEIDTAAEWLIDGWKRLSGR